MTETFYVTTPIYYVNDVPHIGHAYTTLAADVLARYYRLAGREVFFLTGTDEHGQKMQRSAEQKGITAQALADTNSEHFRDLWSKMNISFDDFIRTTEDRHHQGVVELYKKMEAGGDIYLGEYEDWYCVPDEAYYTEKQLTDGKCPMCGGEVEMVKEPSYFFRMSKYGEQLLSHIEQHPEFIQPQSRRNEVVSFVKEGLRDLSISRTSFDWGFHVPGDDKHVIYVWLDALANYLSALGFGSRDQENHQTFWPANVHLVGKDILRFHAVYWPCFLMSAGLPLPHTVFAHGWWTNQGKKMSKRWGNFIAPLEMIEKYGLDAFRYFLMREVSFGLDGDFSESAFVGRINADLANDLGNLLSRTAGMMNKYFAGELPKPAAIEPIDQDLIDGAAIMAREVEECFAAFKFNDALVAIWAYINKLNKYIDATGPWTLFKDPAQAERLGTVLYNPTEALRIISLFVYPFMPETALKMREQLGLDEPIDALPLAQAGQWGRLEPGTRVTKGQALFPRVE